MQPQTIEDRKLVLPDFSAFTEEQLMNYIDTEVKKFSINREASRKIKEAMLPVVLERINAILNRDRLLSQLQRLLVLVKIYGYTRTGILFNPIYKGFKEISNEDLIQQLLTYFNNADNIDFYDYPQIVGIVNMLNNRHSENL
jgi:hypothetical protein